jgi:putative endonuclease
MHYVYILRCSDDSLYTGYTTNINRRLNEHNNKNGAKYTRGRTPVTLKRVEIFNDKSTAMSREYEIKQKNREEKQKLVPDEEKIINLRFSSHLLSD